MLSNRAVVQRFAEGKEGHSSHIHAYKDRLLSYGEHFPLAVRLHNGSILQNGDRYSVTTSHHQALTFHAFPTAPRVAFSALRAAGIVTGSLRLRVVHHTDDLFWEVRPDGSGERDSRTPSDVTWDNFFAKVPPGAMSGEEQRQDGKGPYRRWAHRIGCVVLRFGDHDYLSGMDEGNYFLVRLAHRVRTVEGAFNSLIPDTVKRAKAKGLNVLRQGEWFFVPTDPEPLGIRASRMVGPYDLPRETDRSNIHRATRAMIVTGRPSRGAGLYVRGRVRHLTPWGDSARVSWGRRTPNLHRPLNLRPAAIYRAILNTARGSWSAEGRVD